MQTLTESPADIFTDPAVIAAGLARHNLASGHMVVLRRLHGGGYNNVVMQILGEMNKPVAERQFADSTTEEMAELIFAVTRTGRAGRDTLAKGREHYRESALTEIADKLMPDVLEKLFFAVLADVFHEYFQMNLTPPPTITSNPNPQTQTP